MHILSDLIGELQHQAHAHHTNLKMQKTLFPFCQEDAFFAMQLHVMENRDMHAPEIKLNGNALGNPYRTIKVGVLICPALIIYITYHEQTYTVKL